MNHSIILTSVYIFGLLGFFTKQEVSFLIVLFLILAVLLLKNFIKPVFAVILALLFIFSNYNAAKCIKTGDKLAKLGFKNNVTLVGRIVTIPEKSRNDSRLRFYFDAQSAKIGGRDYFDLNSKTYVSINSDKPIAKNGSNFDLAKLKIGNVIEIKGKLRKPPVAKNPSQFDYAQYLANKNVFSTFYSEGYNYELLHIPKLFENKKLSNENWWWLFRRLDLIRENIILKHSKYIESPNLEVLGGIVFGDNAVNPPDDIKQTFINSGLLHLLAASGLNVALIFGIWWFFASKFVISYKLNVFLGMLLVIFYSFMTGFPPSILRATIMILFVLLGKLINKDADGLSLVFFAGLILLIFSPQMLFDVGFQLSFIVTAMLIFCMPIITDSVKNYDLKFKETQGGRNKFIKKIINYFSPAIIIGTIFVPVVAQIAVAPIQAYYFNTFTPYSVFANLCVVPFVGLISFFGFAGSILGSINLDFLMFAVDKTINPLIGALLWVSSYFSNLKGSLLSVSSPSLIQIMLYYLLIYLFFICFKNGFKNKKLVVTFAASILFLALSFVKIQSKNLEVLAFDVDNADSFLITTPTNKHLLIDTGRLPYRGLSQAKMIMNEYFKDESIKDIDLLILTHFDNDHSGGALDIMKNFKVKKVIIENHEPKTVNSREIIKYMKENKIEFQYVKNAEIVYSEPDLELKAFAGKLNLKSDNENSIIALLSYKGSNSLFMGDASASTYKLLKNNFPENIDILKVGHHGAKNSVNDEMLKHLKPKTALISVGYNIYGHPNPEVLKIINENNIPIISTKEFGALKFTYNEQDSTFKTEGFSKGKFKPIEIY